jgi:hypothetical protein
MRETNFLAILTVCADDKGKFMKTEEVKDLIGRTNDFPLVIVVPMTTMGDGDYPDNDNNLDNESIELIMNWLFQLLDHRQGSYCYAGRDCFLPEPALSWRRQMIHWLAIRPKLPRGK